MKTEYRTPRLHLSLVSNEDAPFMRTLVNTDAWIRFIGNRNVTTDEEAITYVQRIRSNPAIHYWVVHTLDTRERVGIVSFIKRDYLDHWDIGFALLPTYTGRGYAFEAAGMVLRDALSRTEHPRVLATTVPENSHSIQLLLKFGFEKRAELQLEEETLHVYALDRSGSKLF